MSEHPELLVDLLIALVVIGAQILLFWRARRQVFKDHTEILESHEARFVEDIARRARRGSAPDWTWYRGEIDRLFEPVDDRLRVLAAAALAAGLGGTIGALIAHLVTGALQGGVEAWSVIPGMGVALFGSLAGVMNHLLIALRMLPRAEARFGAASEQLLRRLRSAEEEHPPAETLVEAFREELSGVREALSTEFSSAFQTAIMGFPDVVEGLKTNMDRLAQAVEDQASHSKGAVEDLRKCSTLVSESSERVEPAAKQLANVSDQLVKLPDRLGQVLAGGRHHWIEEMHEEQRKSRDQISEILNAMQSRNRELDHKVGEIVQSVNALPKEFHQRLESMSESLGAAFARDARNANLDLAQRIDGAYRQHLEEVRAHEQEWQNTLGHSVGKVLDEISSRLDSEVLQRLDGLADELGGASVQLFEVSERLREAHERWCRVHEDALDGWRRVGERVEGAAETLAAGETHLEQTVSALGESADHLDRIARLNEEFESALQESLKQVTGRHLEELQPVYGEVSRMVEELQATRSKFDGILGRQSEFIRGLIAQIVDGRGLGSRPSAPEADA